MSIVKSFSLGSGDIRGDMFYIRHNADCFTVIDCYLTEKDGRIDEIIQEIKNESSESKICRFISTHPDNDHICGLEKLFAEWNTKNFYAVKNSYPKEENNSSLDKYIELRDSVNYPIARGIKRAYLNQGEKVTGSSGLSFLWPDVNNEKFKGVLESVEDGGSPNNICPVFIYSVENSATFMWMGDLETDMQTEFYEQYKSMIPKVNILFAPHHGRESGKVPTDLLSALDPEIIVIGDAPSEHIHYYDALKHILGDSQVKALQSDGYNVYMYLDDHMVDIEHLCCMAHARAKFKYTLDQGNDKDAAFILELIGELYRLERGYEEGKLSPGR